jgi:hypothetical protein
MNGSADQH